jgi:hypothetical protein
LTVIEGFASSQLKAKAKKKKMATKVRQLQDESSHEAPYPVPSWLSLSSDLDSTPSKCWSSASDSQRGCRQWSTHQGSCPQPRTPSLSLNETKAYGMKTKKEKKKKNDCPPAFLDADTAMFLEDFYVDGEFYSLPIS